MEAVSINDKRGMEICKQVGQMLVDELDNEEVWKRIQDSLADYLERNNIKEDAAGLEERLEWSVQVRLKK